MIATNRTTKGRPGGRRAVSALVVALLVCSGTWPGPSAAQASVGIDVEQLLAKAEQAIAVNRLTTPADDNAVAYIEQVLAQAPGNRRALDLLDEVTKGYAALVKGATDRANQARARSLERAITFRARAAGVIAKHGLDQTPLAEIDRHIAGLSGAGAKPQAILQSLVAGHVTLAEMFLERKDRPEAEWHAEQAEALAGRYGLEDERWPQLRQRLAVEQAREPSGMLARDERKETDPQTRLKLTELAAFYVASSRAELEGGNVSGAQRDEQAAKELIAQYQLSDDLVAQLSGQLLARASARIQPPLFKVYGTF